MLITLSKTEIKLCDFGSAMDVGEVAVDGFGLLQGHMSCSLNSLKGGYIEAYIGDYCRGY